MISHVYFPNPISSPYDPILELHNAYYDALILNHTIHREIMKHESTLPKHVNITILVTTDDRNIAKSVEQVTRDVPLVMHVHVQLYVLLTSSHLTSSHLISSYLILSHLISCCHVVIDIHLSLSQHMRGDIDVSLPGLPHIRYLIFPQDRSEMPQVG